MFTFLSLIRRTGDSEHKRRDTPSVLENLPQNKPNREFHLSTSEEPANKPSKLLSNKYSRHAKPQPPNAKVSTEDFEEETKVVVTVKSTSKENQANEVKVQVTVSPQVNRKNEVKVETSGADDFQSQPDIQSDVQIYEGTEGSGRKDVPALSIVSERTEITKQLQGEEDNNSTNAEEPTRAMSKQAWTPQDTRPLSVQSCKLLPSAGIEDKVQLTTPRSKSVAGQSSGTKRHDRAALYEVQANADEQNRPIRGNEERNIEKPDETLKQSAKEKPGKEKAESPDANLNNSAFSPGAHSDVYQLHRASSSALLRPIQQVNDSDLKLMNTDMDLSDNEAFSSVACKHNNISQLYMVCNVTGGLIEVHHCSGEDDLCDVRQVYRDIERTLSSQKQE